MRVKDSKNEIYVHIKLYIGNYRLTVSTLDKKCFKCVYTNLRI